MARGAKVIAVSLSLAMIAVIYQNCSVRRLESTNGVNLSSWSGTGGTSGTGGGSGGGGESCKPAPSNIDVGSFVLADAFKSQDANVSRLKGASLNSTSVSLFAGNSCIEDGHACTTSGSDGGGGASCVSAKMTMLSVSFKCSNSSTSGDCDLITPGESVDLAGKMSGAGIKDLSISFMSSIDTCPRPSRSRKPSRVKRSSVTKRLSNPSPARFTS